MIIPEFKLSEEKKKELIKQGKKLTGKQPVEQEPEEQPE